MMPEFETGTPGSSQGLSPNRVLAARPCSRDFDAGRAAGLGAAAILLAVLFRAEVARLGREMTIKEIFAPRIERLNRVSTASWFPRSHDNSRSASSSPKINRVKGDVSPTGCRAESQGMRLPPSPTSSFSAPKSRSGHTQISVALDRNQHGFAVPS